MLHQYLIIVNAIPRLSGPPDWIFFWCLISITLIALAKRSNAKVFSSFLQLLFTNNYLQLYANSIVARGIHFWMSMLFVTTLPLYYYVVEFLRGNYIELDVKEYLFFVGYLSSFLVVKRSLEFLLAATFLKKKGIRRFMYEKQSYLNYLAIIFFLPINIILYSSFNNPYLNYLLIALFVFLWVLAYLLVISRFRNQFSFGWRYFILYLCALELAPTCLTYIMILNGIE